jgi:hypothetical protein
LKNCKNLKKLRLFNDKHFEDIDKYLPQLELITVNGFGLNDNTINCLARMPLL